MSRRVLMFGAGISVLVVAVGVVWFAFLRSDAPPPVSLDEAVAAVGGTDPTVPGESAGSAEDASTTTPDPADGLEPVIAGSWSVDAATSFVGYRIGEELAGIGTGDAAGRTSDVMGELTIEGSSVVEVGIEADLTTLTSDNATRDGQLRSRGLETDVFPTATFTLGSPIELEAVPEPGVTIIATALGNLTLHGVTNQVEMPIEGQLLDDTTMVVVGSVAIELADYDIEPPTGMRVLSIEDTGTIELQLTLVPE